MGKVVSEVIIAKQRNGPIGTVELVWLPNYTKFANKEKQRNLKLSQITTGCDSERPFIYSAEQIKGLFCWKQTKDWQGKNLLNTGTLL